MHYTADPIPNLRALGLSGVSGHAYVPEHFSGSANTEFELLTGMSRSFLPEGSVPYLQYLRHPVPSLPRVLRKSGYSTIAIQADPKYWYDRERAYELLGFERALWLRSGDGLERAPRGAWVSDRELVRVIIRTSQEGRPFFAFAFPSSTHSPYNTGVFASSDLDVVDLPEPEAGEVKEYLNALRVADSAIGAMVDYFRRRPEPTIIVVLGDHLPPLSERALRPYFARLAALPEAERARLTRRVPLLVWSNRHLPREELEVCTSLLPSYLLRQMGVPGSGLFAVTDRVRQTIPVLPARASDGGGQSEQALVDDYRMVQYDLLLGRQFGLGTHEGARKGGIPEAR